MDAENSADESLLHALIEQQTAAWNRGDAKAFAALYTEKARFIAGHGGCLVDRTAIENAHEFIFSTCYKGSEVSVEIESILVPTPDVAIIDGFHRLRNYAFLPLGVVETEPGVLHSRLRSVAVRHHAEWRFMAAQNTYILPQRKSEPKRRPPAGRLRPFHGLPAPRAIILRLRQARLSLPLAHFRLSFPTYSSMSAHDQGSGPRSNRYSENRLTNWAGYEPWWLEIQQVHKRFDGRIAKRPKFPKVIALPPFTGFMRPCSAADVERKLSACAPEFLLGLRAVFVLSGTVRQRKSWHSMNAFYGHYWQDCVFLHAYPWGKARLEPLRDFYLRDVLIHEIGHHVDTWNTSYEDRERFAEAFAAKHG